ncbi:MAG: hypothetical protein KDC98_14465, partial [Planctomycetes bacterium]|nr:hypothetical protein [Planctomycetota bacterium]
MSSVPFSASPRRACHRTLPRVLSRPLFSILLAATASAQCTMEWVPSASVPGVDHWVRAITAWDPDGAGPASEVVVIGGRFTSGGPVAAQMVVSFDFATGTWSAMGDGFSDGGYPEMEAFATLPNGDLVAGGDFTRSGSTVVNGIARWDGTAWQPLGSGMNGPVFSLAVTPARDLIAGGAFTLAGGVAANNIARWDGTAWHPLGAGVNSSVTALAVLPNGDVA